MTPEKDEGLVGEVETVKGQAAAGAQGDSVGLVKLSCKRDHCFAEGSGFLHIHELLLVHIASLSLLD